MTDTTITYQHHRWRLSHYERQGGQDVAVLVRSVRQYSMGTGGHTVEIVRYVPADEFAKLRRET